MRTDAVEKLVEAAWEELKLMAAGASTFQSYEIQDRLKWVAQAVAEDCAEIIAKHQCGCREDGDEYSCMNGYCEASYDHARDIQDKYGLTKEEKE